MKVKIIGAGSIGNHHAKACRTMGWDVTVVDTSLDALERMKCEIYPTRYGEWDSEIKLRHDYSGGNDVPKGGFDIIMVDTPPNVRMALAIEALKEQPKLLHLEKPLCQPETFFSSGLELFSYNFLNIFPCMATVGYNHAVSKSIEKVVEIIKIGEIGPVIALDVEFREHWEGIFKAHPWLKGPEDSYLGDWRKGGGAGGEHSHALHLWLYLAKMANLGDVANVKSAFDMVENKYDRVAAFTLQTSEGKIGRVIQDVVTKPPRKWARVQGTEGFVQWDCNEWGLSGDVVRFAGKFSGQKEKTIFVSKNRQLDFLWMMQHYDDLLSGKTSYKDSPLHIEFGVKVMSILHDAHHSDF